MTATFVIGDSLTVLRSMPDASVDFVCSSPPFLALRSYLPADHPAKADEMGSEATPGEYLDALLDVVEECRRVLAPHGSIAFELGDTYSGSGGAGGDYDELGLRDGQQKFSGSAAKRRKNGQADNDRPSRYGGVGWALDKSLTLIPESLRWAMAYGRNPFTGRETPQWRVRNVIRWHRPNPPVGALADKVRPSTTDIVTACTSRTRWFDLDAMRTPPTSPAGQGTAVARTFPRNGGQDRHVLNGSNPGGAPPLDTWTIPTEPSSLAHYAMWPSELARRLILLMCPIRVCTECGEPSRRITSEGPLLDQRGRIQQGTFRRDGSFQGSGSASKTDGGLTRSSRTVGWTDCGHDAWRQGVTLDPFAGTFTTGYVAVGNGRSAIGIDLDERNLDLARQRLGWLLTDWVDTNKGESPPWAVRAPNA